MSRAMLEVPSFGAKPPAPGPILPSVSDKFRQLSCKHVMNFCQFQNGERIVSDDNATSAAHAAIQDMLDRARTDDELASRILANPAAMIAEATGHALAPGILVEATRGADGAVSLSARQDPDFVEESEDPVPQA